MINNEKRKWGLSTDLGPFGWLRGVFGYNLMLGVTRHLMRESNKKLTTDNTPEIKVHVTVNVKEDKEKNEPTGEK